MEKKKKNFASKMRRRRTSFFFPLHTQKNAFWRREEEGGGSTVKETCSCVGLSRPIKQNKIWWGGGGGARRRKKTHPTKKKEQGCNAQWRLSVHVDNVGMLFSLFSWKFIKGPLGTPTHPHTHPTNNPLLIYTEPPMQRCC